MSRFKAILIFALRISMGWLLLYAGFSKITNPEWSAAGFLKSAETFPALYEWFGSPAMLPITNFLNEWGQVLLGLAIIFGVVMTLSSILAALMMVLYYLPALNFPFVGEHSLLVDEHIIYAIVFLLLGALKAGQYWGLGCWWADLPLWKRYPRLKVWLT